MKMKTPTQEAQEKTAKVIEGLKQTIVSCDEEIALNTEIEKLFGVAREMKRHALKQIEFLENLHKVIY